MKKSKNIQAQGELNDLIGSLNNDYSKFGELSEYVREDTIKQLKKIKRLIK